MIMARNADGSYSEIAVIKTKDGSNIGEIRDKDGSVYFTSAVNATAEGYPCILLKSVGKNATDYIIYGNFAQDGTLSPENPVDAVSVGEPVTEGELTGKYKIPVVTSGKNLLDNNLNWAAITFQPSDGKYFASTTSALSPFINIEGNKQYSLSINDGLQVGVFANFYIFDENKKHIGNNSTLDANYTSYTYANVQSTSTKILPANAKYIRIGVKSYTKDEKMPINTAKSLMVQVEEGSTATPYEPYKQPITTNIYLDEPLKTGEILKFPENVLIHADETEEMVILPEMPTFKGTTVITTDTEILPSDMKITYKSRR